MAELFQMYDPQGRPITDHGATQDELFLQGRLHGAAHVWIWRGRGSGQEVLVQERAHDKRTWPGLLDISAAGHIDFGEEPLACVRREAQEEIGLDMAEEDLELVDVHRTYLVAPNGNIENELQWVFLYQMKQDTELALQTEELRSVRWITLDGFRSQVLGKGNGTFVPHGDAYYLGVIRAILRMEHRFHTP